jgi:hypothetical protein
VSDSAQQGDEITWGMAIGPVIHVRTHNAHDIAILQVNMPQQINQAPLPLETVPYEEGDDIGICGYPFGWHLKRDQLAGMAWTPSFCCGIVSAVLPFPNAPTPARTVFQVDASINGGNSGGPVLTSKPGG